MLLVFVAQQISTLSVVLTNPKAKVTAVLVFILGLTILYRIATRYGIFKDYPHRLDLGKFKVLKYTGIAVASVGGIFVASILSQVLKSQFGLTDVAKNQDVIQKLAENGNIHLLILTILAAPMFEEILFRWFIFEKLCPSGSRWLPFTISTVAFAAAHVTAAGLTDINGWLTYLPMSIVITYVYKKFGDIRLNILVHFLWNAISAVAIVSLI